MTRSERPPSSSPARTPFRENRWFGAFAILPMLLAMACPARAASDIGHVTIVHATCTSLTIAIQLNSGWEPSPNPHKATYKLTGLLTGAALSDNVSSNESTIEMKDWLEGWQYDYLVEARSRHKNGNGIPLYRRVAELQGSLPLCDEPNPNGPQPGDVRLRHELTGKCIFGNPVDGGPAKTFTCWQDPEMAIVLEPLGGSEFRIRLRAKGKCLYADPNNGGTAKNFTCWPDPNMVFIMESLGNNRYRLRHKATGQCLYGSTIEAGAVHNWGCWNDPAMVWVKDTF